MQLACEDLGLDLPDIDTSQDDIIGQTFTWRKWGIVKYIKIIIVVLVIVTSILISMGYNRVLPSAIFLGSIFNIMNGFESYKKDKSGSKLFFITTLFMGITSIYIICLP